ARTRDRIAQKTQSQLEQARHLLDAGSLDDAAAVLTEVASLDPQADGLATLQTTLRQAREAQRAEARASAPTPARTRSAEPSRPRLSARELDQLYHRGLDAMNRHDSEEATRYWELVWAANPKYGAVSEYLTREYLTRGMEAFAAGRLSAAVESWERVLRIDPNNARAAAYVSRAQKQISRTKQILG